MIGEALALTRLLSNRRLSPADLRELQERKLRALVQHASEYVPYYRSLFDSVGLSPEDIRHLEDLKLIPVTTKDDLRAAGIERTISKETDLQACTLRRSSGTTGKPFEVCYGDREMRDRRLIAFRGLLSMGFSPRDRLCLFGVPKPYRRRIHHRLGLYRTDSVSVLLPLDEQIARLERMQPSYLSFWPTPMRTVLHHLGGHLSRIVRPKAMIASAEVLPDSLRNELHADLSPELFISYYACECGEIATECRAHEGLHVNADQLILECVQEDDRPAAPGDVGAVVITSLYQHAMPLIRYRLGDLASVARKACSCGSPFPLMSPPQGRNEEVIRLPSGSILSMIRIGYALVAFDEIDQYRLIQESIDRLTLLLVMRAGSGSGLIPQVRAKVLERLGEAIHLDIQLVDSIPEERRKFRRFISKLADSGIQISAHT